MPVEGPPFRGELVSIGDEGALAFRLKNPLAEAGPPRGGPVRLLRVDELVRWGHPVEARAQTWVALADGSLLVAAADWSGGVPVRTEGEQVVVRSDVFEDIALPRELVRGLVFAAHEHFELRGELLATVRASADEQDVVLLTNEDRLVGDLVQVERGSLTLQLESGEIKLPISRVKAVALGANPVSERKSKYVVGLRDGSLLHAESVRGDEKSLAVVLEDDVRLEGGAIDDVALLQSLSRKRFVYLSELEAADHRHVPYLSIEWPYRLDRNVVGGPLSVGGKRYLKGIGMHSAARLTYRLDGNYQRFEAAAAIDDSAGRRGSVTFGVYVLREGKWQQAYKSGVVRGGDAPVPVSVDVRGAQGLTLMVDYAERGDELDHADWLDARLVAEEQ